jgi:non-specific serine/threonine protein kinase
MIGQTISHYKILEKIGEGGMGVVYKAQDTKLDRTVALKFLPQSQASDSVERERFIHEAKAASALNHPNITTIYEIGEHDSQLFIAMELIEGETLQHLARKNSLPVERALEIGIQICEALAGAHEKGIIHRDIKSDNIMLTPKGLVKIMDFGLAKLKGASKLTRTGSTVGTAAYMSPEQAQGEEVDQRSDIFSFGVVLYELIAGQLPFRGEHQAAIIYSICNEEPEPLARYRSGVSESLQRIIDKALTKEKEERYQHIADLAADLKRAKRELGTGLKQAPKSDKKSVAVLYFENLSSDPESDYFAAGMTEDIITDLSKIEGIRVASRNAVLPFKGKPVDIPVLGRKLNLDAVLEGSIRKAGNRLRITAQLIDVKEGFHLWAERYDRQVSEIFDLQEEIAKNIASALKIKLSPKEEEKIALKYKGNPQAYEFYLKGRNYYHKYTKSDMLAAIQMFKQALENDPNYALAYAGLADSYYQMVEKGFDNDKTLMSRAEETAQKSLEIDPNCAEAYKALGTIYGYLNRYNTGIKLLRKALEINPTYVPARINLGFYMQSLGKFEEAEKEFLLAREHDPSLIFSVFALASLHLARQNYSQSEEYAKKLIESGESSFFIVAGNYILAKVYVHLRQYDKAIYHAQQALELKQGGTLALSSGLAVAYAAKGERKLALEIVTEISLEQEPHLIAIGNLVLTYAILGEKEKVYEWLKKGIASGHCDYVYLETDPLLEEMRREPEFQRLLAQIKDKVLNSP